MNMFVFEKVAARELSPTQGADELVRMRHPDQPRHGLLFRVLYAMCFALLGALVPSLSDKRA